MPKTMDFYLPKSMDFSLPFTFRKILEKNEVLTEFDRCVFESIVEKVIIGEVDENGNTNPYKLTFIYKTEYSNSIQSKMHKQINRKRTQNDVKDLPSHPSTDTR